MDKYIFIFILLLIITFSFNQKDDACSSPKNPTTRNDCFAISIPNGYCTFKSSIE